MFVFLPMFLSFLAGAACAPAVTPSIGGAGSDPSPRMTPSTTPPPSPPSGTLPTPPEEEPGEPTRSEAPCETPSAVARSAGGELLIGCAEGGGLWKAEAAGAWTRVLDSHELEVSAMQSSPEGVLVTGRDWSTGALAWRVGSETLVLATLEDIDPDDLRLNGRAIAGDGDRLLISLGAGLRLALSEDGGASWTATESPEEDEEEQDERNVLLSIEGGFVGGGAPAGGEPTFYRAADDELLPLVARTVVADLQGEVAALATPDGGCTWLAGGAGFSEDGDLMGFLARSTDGGLLFSRLAIDADLLPEGIAFDEDGQHAVVVGSRADEPREGFLLLSDDAGASFTPWFEGLPALRSVKMSGGRFWAVGQGTVIEGSI